MPSEIPGGNLVQSLKSKQKIMFLFDAMAYSTLRTVVHALPPIERTFMLNNKEIMATACSQNLLTNQ